MQQQRGRGIWVDVVCGCWQSEQRCVGVYSDDIVSLSSDHVVADDVGWWIVDEHEWEPECVDHWQQLRTCLVECCSGISIAIGDIRRLDGLAVCGDGVLCVSGTC